MTTDRELFARNATRAFEHAGERLAERGVSDIEIGRAMVAAGLSRWSRGASGAQLVEELAKLTAGLAAAAGVEIDRTPSNSSTAH